ncbi:MAG: aminopeptidase P family protein [Betaproteobacteria bacterium]|nr:aminopeptidase P family protein [Betaproteobacteria bacterium]
MQRIDFAARIAALGARLRKEGASAYVGTRQASLHYLNGAFMPWRGAVIVTADGKCENVYWAMDASRVKAEGEIGTLREFHFDGMIEAIREALVSLGASNGRIGLDLSHPGAAQVAPGMLTASEYLDLVATLPSATFENGVRWIDDVMLLKSPAEIERLRHAAHVSDIGFRAGFAAVREGVTENHVAGVIEAAIRDNGSTWAWAVTGGTEVGSGPRTGFLRGVTQQSTDRKIGRDEFVILDLHPMLDLYLADTAIPVFIGKPDDTQAKMIACWEDVAATMLASLKPGRPIPDCVREGIATFAKHGFQDFGLPLFGHGLGTCARTRPFINLRSDDVVQPGMVVALGTHLYVPGSGGMRLEYPAVITERGAEPLVQTPAKVHYVA